MSNPGNKGHGGYKLQRVTAVEPVGDRLLIKLECGHNREHRPFLFALVTMEQEAQSCQYWIGTRMRCERCRMGEKVNKDGEKQ